jgi:hypothetical protein
VYRNIGAIRHCIGYDRHVSFAPNQWVASLLLLDRADRAKELSSEPRDGEAKKLRRR